jgi:hypothetical protein
VPSRPRTRSGWASGAPRSPRTPPPAPVAAPSRPARGWRALAERAGDVAAGWSPTAGRYLLGLVFAWFGYHEIGKSGNYTQYVPFVAETSRAATILVSMHGFVLMVLAVAFFAGLAPRLTAAVSTLVMLEIVVDLAVNGLSDTTFRDVGVLGLAVVLAGSKNHRLLLRL